MFWLSVEQTVRILKFWVIFKPHSTQVYPRFAEHSVTLLTNVSLQRCSSPSLGDILCVAFCSPINLMLLSSRIDRFFWQQTVSWTPTNFIQTVTRILVAFSSLRKAVKYFLCQTVGYWNHLVNKNFWVPDHFF